jgi:hypothetical protein
MPHVVRILWYPSVTTGETTSKVNQDRIQIDLYQRQEEEEEIDYIGDACDEEWD